MSLIRTYFFYFTIFITGAAILVIEILGTRVLTPFYGSTIYVWSSLITITLLFLALGYFLGGKIADKKPELNLLYWIIFFAGITTILIPKYSSWLLSQTDRFGLKYGPLIASFFLFFAPLLLLGMVSPFAVKIKTQKISSLGRRAGNLYALATLGSLVGALLTGFYLISNFPVSRIINTIGLVLIILFFLWQIQLVGKSNKTILSSLILLVFFFLPSCPLSESEQDSSSEIIYQTQSFYGDIKVIKYNSFDCIFVNGIGQSCINKEEGKDTSSFRVLSDIVSQMKPKTILSLGMGSGSFLTDVPEDSEIDVVEIDPKIVEISEKYNLIPEKEYKIYYDDARHFIKAVGNKYDLVVMDLFIGENIPSYMLTEESFEEIKMILSEKGIFNIHLPPSPEEEQTLFLTSVIKTLNNAFDFVGATGQNSDNISFSNIIVSPTSEAELDGVYRISNLDLSKARIITDDYNPLEEYYLPYALGVRDAFKSFGTEVFLVQ